MEFSLCDRWVRRGYKVEEGQTDGFELTFNVILGIRVRCFVVVHHLHHLEKVILAKSLEAVGQLVHVDLHSKGTVRKSSFRTI